MLAPAVLQQTFRAGTFQSLAFADRAVQSLLTAGFVKERITVLCTDEAANQHFRELGYQRPAPSEAPDGVAAGAITGATMCGLAALAVGAAGGVPLLIAGAAGLAGGSATGGFLGALLEGETQNEIVTYYDQELRHGRILVVVETRGLSNDAQLTMAVQILSKSEPHFEE